MSAQAVSSRVGKSYYLPDEVPPFGQMIILGFQHVIAMFPATALVALLVGFDVGAVLVTSGIATALLVSLSWKLTGRPIPLYYGSSFSYIAATAGVTGAVYGQYAGQDAVSLAQTGIVITGVVNIIVGILVRAAGGERIIEKVLPPIITGTVALVIGFALAKAALDMAMANPSVALVTLAVTGLASVYLRGRGFIGLLPVIIGVVVGCIASLAAGILDFSAVSAAPFLQRPQFTLPNFSDPGAIAAIASIAIMAVATIPESTAHLFQISLYVDNLAEEVKHKPYNLKSLIGINLMLDGLGDILSGMFGGVSTTNYGENNGLMAITRNYSGAVLIIAGFIAIALGFVGKLSAFVGAIPLAVTGGLAIYFFGVIGLQGIALKIHRQVDLTNPKNLLIGSAIAIIGIGGHISYPGGFLPMQVMDIVPYLKPIFPQGLPAIATAAVVGVLFHLLFSLIDYIISLFKAEEPVTNEQVKAFE